MNLKWAMVAGLAVAGAAIWAAAHEGHLRSANPGSAPDGPRRPSDVVARAIGLQTAEVTFERVEDVVRLSGVVRARPDRRVAVATPVAGLLAELRVQPGDLVRRGDEVAVLNSSELARLVHEQLRAEVEFEHARSVVVSTRASLNTLRAQLAAARRQADLAEEELARMKAAGEAVGINVLAQREAAAIQARAQADSLGLTLDQQTRELESLERQAEAGGKAAAALANVIAMVQSGITGGEPGADPVGVVRLRSPLDGVVVTRNGVVGQGVESGRTLAEIADYSDVQVVGEVPESLLMSLGEGSHLVGAIVRIRSSAGGPELGEGVVRGAAPAVDPVKRTAHVLIDAPNPRGVLREGMYVDLSIVQRDVRSAVAVPLSAVLGDGPARSVFVEQRGALVRRDVRIGISDDRFAEVIEGLVPGDRVVVQGAYAVSQLPPVADSPPPAAPGR